MHTIRIRDKYQKMTNSTLAKSGKWSTVEEEAEELLDKGLEIMYNGKKSIANKKKALKYFDKALKLDPKNEEAIYLLMDIEIERSNFAKVKELKENFEKVCSKLCPKISSINEKLKNFDTKNES